MAFKRHDRQKIVDAYLAATCRNMFIPGEFIDWLADKPDHVAYPLFFGKDDEAAAREYRIDLARRYVSGLRIVANVSSAPSEAQTVTVTVAEFPSYLSSMAARRNGGGYEPFDPGDPIQGAELRRQGATALRSWLARYRGAFEAAGLPVAPVEALVQAVDAEGDVALAG